MYKLNQKKLLLTFAVNIFVLNGCSSLPLTGINPNKATENEVQTGKTEALKFSKVPTDKVAQLSNFMSRGLTPNGQASDTAAPMASPSAAPSAAASSAPVEGAMPVPYPASTDHDVPGGYYPSAVPYYPPTSLPYTPSPYSYFMPGSASFEEYSVVDFEQATRDGFTGSYLSTMKSVITPIITGLASDARLISTYGNTDSKGRTIKSNPVPTAMPMQSAIPVDIIQTAVPYTDYNQYQWQFTYVSSAKKEVYSILVSSNETLILKQKWGLKDLSPQNIKIDSTEAIEIVRKAVQDKNRSVPQSSPTPSPYYGSPGSNTYDNGSEEIYDIPEDAVINYTLEKSKADPEWFISFYINNYTEANTSYNSGYATVNARTGELTSFNRIVKYRYTPYYPTSTPTANIYVTPIPSPPISDALTETQAIEILRKAVINEDIPDPQPSASPFESTGAEEIFDIPENAVIISELGGENGEYDWYIRFRVNENRLANITYSEGYARINAVTGEIDYFHRIFKYTYSNAL
jgi:hypothetical protein